MLQRICKPNGNELAIPVEGLIAVQANESWSGVRYSQVLKKAASRQRRDCRKWSRRKTFRPQCQASFVRIEA